jgi:hypothetical protein
MLAMLLVQDTAGSRAERLSPGKGRSVPLGVLGDAANRNGGASPTRATPRLGKRKNAEVPAWNLYPITIYQRL